MGENEFENRLQVLLDVSNKRDKTVIDSKKNDLLFTTCSYYEIVYNYIFLEKIGFHNDFGCKIIKKGTTLYRIRKIDKYFDFNNSEEWGPSPYKNINRANKDGETAMYFNVLPELCELETHLKSNDKYAIARYEVIEDIKVGGFFESEKDNRMLLAGILLNSFLIAPSRSEKNKEIFNLLEDKYGKISMDAITKDDIIMNDFELPLKIAVITPKDYSYYSLTNAICDCIKKFYPEGIRYSSCYAPIETIGIQSNCYNLVLYEEGIKKIKFLDAKRCVFNKTLTSTGMIKSIFAAIEMKKR